jgi:lipopolysaccharide export LptBFGC system permease protein LptF
MNFDSILIAVEKALPIMVIIFLVVFTLIVLARVILTSLLNHALKQYRKLKNSDKNIFKKVGKKYIKDEDELLRGGKDFKEIPRAHSAVKAEKKARGGAEASGTYELMVSKEQELDKAQLSEMNIVDIVKPIGFWTSMILGQKLTYLIQAAQTINDRDKKGFWVSMIEAKDRAAGRQQGRER